jgi:hypothetical protein
MKNIIKFIVISLMCVVVMSCACDRTDNTPPPTDTPQVELFNTLDITPSTDVCDTTQQNDTNLVSKLIKYDMLDDNETYRVLLNNMVTFNANHKRII